MLKPTVQNNMHCLIHVVAPVQSSYKDIKNAGSQKCAEIHFKLHRKKTISQVKGALENSCVSSMYGRRVWIGGKLYLFVFRSAW